MNVFDEQAQNYSTLMDETVGWVGQDHDFFVAAKARILIETLRRYRGDPKQAAVLDVGCGIGLIETHLAGAVGSLHGVDVSDESIRVAARNCPGAGFLPYDGHRIPHPDNAFDLAFAVCVLHHVPPPQWEHFAAEMARVLKPGGVAVVIEHNPINPVTRYIVSHHPFDHDAVLLPARRSVQLMRHAGLAIREKRYTTFIPFPVPMAAQLEKLLGWLPLGAQYYVVAVKA